MIVDHVEAGIVQYLAKARAVEYGSRCLLRDKRRKISRPAPQGDDIHAVIYLRFDGGRSPMKRGISIGIVNDGNLVTSLHKRLREALDRNRVAAKTLGRIERGGKTESHRAMVASGWDLA